MRHILLQFWLTVSLLGTALGCTQGAAEPKEPVWGKQPCENCAMLLSEKQHGAQVLTRAGDRLYFDDLGCLVAWSEAHPGEAQAQWARTADTQAWLPLDKAGYAPAAHTPMDFGFIATAKPGTVTWQQVSDAVHAKLRAKPE